jgi:hypothetical protein
MPTINDAVVDIQRVAGQLVVADEGAGSAFGYVIARCRSESAPCDEIIVGVDLATWRHAEEGP